MPIESFSVYELLVIAPLYHLLQRKPSFSAIGSCIQSRLDGYQRECGIDEIRTASEAFMKNLSRTEVQNFSMTGRLSDHASSHVT